MIKKEIEQIKRDMLHSKASYPCTKCNGVCYIENCRGCSYEKEPSASYKDIIASVCMVGIIIIVCLILV